jgi:hypothetical protein
MKRLETGFPVTRRGVLQESLFYCLHFSADRRTHRLSNLEAEPMADLPSVRFTAEWLPMPDGGLLGSARFADTVVCRAVLLPDMTVGAARATLGWHEQLLRHDGERLDTAVRLAPYPCRPLLATFARRVDFSPPVLCAVQRLMLAAALTAETSGVALSAAPIEPIPGQRAIDAGDRGPGHETRAVWRTCARYGCASGGVTGSCEAAIHV